MTGEYEHRKTRVYIVLANKGKQRSIELIPLPPKTCSPVEQDAIMEQSSPTVCSMSLMESLSVKGNALGSSESSLEQVWPDSNFQSAKVLLSLALEEEQLLHINDWAGWIRSLPALVTPARVQGIYKSGSSLVLLSIPVAVWDLIPDDPAIAFIGFIRSENLLQSHPISLTELQKPGMEKSSTPLSLPPKDGPNPPDGIRSELCSINYHSPQSLAESPQIGISRPPSSTYEELRSGPQVTTSVTRLSETKAERSESSSTRSHIRTRKHRNGFPSRPFPGAADSKGHFANNSRGSSLSFRRESCNGPTVRQRSCSGSTRELCYNSPCR